MSQLKDCLTKHEIQDAGICLPLLLWPWHRYVLVCPLLLSLSSILLTLSLHVLTAPMDLWCKIHELISRQTWSSCTWASAFSYDKQDAKLQWKKWNTQTEAIHCEAGSRNTWAILEVVKDGRFFRLTHTRLLFFMQLLLLKIRRWKQMDGIIWYSVPLAVVCHLLRSYCILKWRRTD